MTRWTRPAQPATRRPSSSSRLLLGAGGMLMYPPAVLAEMRAICARHGVLFIADEVMTGWGRTGTLIACEQAGVVPDIMCLAKGLTGGSMPLAVTLASAPIYEAHLSQDRARMFFHSSSFTANPIACAAAGANLAIWREEPVLERIARLAEREAEGFARIAERHPVKNLRQCGTDHRVRSRGRRMPATSRSSARGCSQAFANRTSCSARSATRSTSCRPIAFPTRTSARSSPPSTMR